MSKVFISCKIHDINNNLTKDYVIAKELYSELTNSHIDAFFSEITLVEAARADYKKKIDEELDKASVLIVVASSKNNAESNWVRYEWDSFYNEILSEKKKGELISLLYSTNITDLPRTLRQTQSFDYSDNGISKVVLFIQNYLKLNEKSYINKCQKLGSSYGYDFGNEKERLRIQAQEESKNDSIKIENLLSKFDVDSCDILDFGCSIGETTKRVFSALNKRVSVLGVDKFSECVEEFNEKLSNYKALCANIDDDDFLEKVKNVMHINKIKGFHLVYCALSLHHTANTLDSLKKLWQLLLPGGYIYIRTCDDGLKIGYPDNDNLIQSVLTRTAALRGVSDRYHGRKIYNALEKAHYINIELNSFPINTIGKDSMDRYALFSNTFLWRKNYFMRALKNASESNDDIIVNNALSDYNWATNKIDEIEELFSNPGFFYEYYVTIAIAMKKAL